MGILELQPHTRGQGPPESDGPLWKRHRGPSEPAAWAKPAAWPPNADLVTLTLSLLLYVFGEFISSSQVCFLNKWQMHRINGSNFY